MGSFKCECEGEFTALAAFALHPNLFVMCIYNGFGNIKSKSDTRFVETAALVALVESLEHVGEIYADFLAKQIL